MEYCIYNKDVGSVVATGFESELTAYSALSKIAKTRDEKRERLGLPSCRDKLEVLPDKQKIFNYISNILDCNEAFKTEPSEPSCRDCLYYKGAGVCLITNYCDTDIEICSSFNGNEASPSCRDCLYYKWTEHCSMARHFNLCSDFLDMRK